MKYNLTEKLKFNEDPVLQIRDVELTIKSDAEIVLRLMDVMNGRGQLAAAREAMDLLLSPGDKKKLDGLKLKADDYIQVMNTAVALALGNDPDEEESGE